MAASACVLCGCVVLLAVPVCKCSSLPHVFRLYVVVLVVLAALAMPLCVCGCAWALMWSPDLTSGSFVVVTKNTLAPFDCVGTNGLFTMDADPSIVCGVANGPHARMRAVAIAMVRSDVGALLPHTSCGSARLCGFARLIALSDSFS